MRTALPLRSPCRCGRSSAVIIAGHRPGVGCVLSPRVRVMCVRGSRDMATGGRPRPGAVFVPIGRFSPEKLVSAHSLFLAVTPASPAPRSSAFGSRTFPAASLIFSASTRGNGAGHTSCSPAGRCAVMRVAIVACRSSSPYGTQSRAEEDFSAGILVRLTGRDALFLGLHVPSEFLHLVCEPIQSCLGPGCFLPRPLGKSFGQQPLRARFLVSLASNDRKHENP